MIIRTALALLVLIVILYALAWIFTGEQPCWLPEEHCL